MLQDSVVAAFELRRPLPLPPQVLYRKALAKQGPERKKDLTKAIGILGTCTNAMDKDRTLWMNANYDEWQQKVPQLLNDVVKSTGF